MGAEGLGPPASRARDDLALLSDAVRAAGETARAFQRSGVRHWLKDDGSPVSDADLAVDEALAATLRAARPHYGWVSEEIGGAACRGRAFIVDPIDGTRAFLRGEDGWSVVAAVVDGGRPVAAAVSSPVRDLLFCAVQGGGAWCNGTPLAVSSRCSLHGATVTMPGPVWRNTDARQAGIRRGGWLSSLALRLCRVTLGGADAAITKPGAHHWDIAAADLVIHEAGGTLTALSGALPRYDTAETAHDAILAGPSRLVTELRAMAVAGPDPFGR